MRSVNHHEFIGYVRSIEAAERFRRLARLRTSYRRTDEVAVTISQNVT